MQRIDLGFLLAATLCLICGVSLGIWMGIVHDFQFAPVHAHLNLVGWASLALFGITYRIYPEMARSRLAVPHFLISTTAAAVFPIGIYFAIAHAFPAIAIAAALAWLTGVILFLCGLVRVAHLAAAWPQRIVLRRRLSEAEAPYASLP